MTDPAPQPVPDVFLRPVRSSNAFEETVERLMQAIKLGVITEGERLPPERELAVHLGVSRVTLRSAIRALQQADLIVSRRGRTGGSFVTWDASAAKSADARSLARHMGDGLVDALKFRQVAEPGAAALAAATPMTDLKRELLAHRLQATVDADADGYRLADSRFHLTIAELAECPSLASSIADLQMRLNDLLQSIPRLSAAIAHAHDQHAAVVDAIVAGRPDEARRHMHDHVEATAALLRGFLG